MARNIPSVAEIRYTGKKFTGDKNDRYSRWNETIRENKAPEISENEHKHTRLILWLELAGIVIILLAAPMMARGVGM